MIPGPPPSEPRYRVRLHDSRTLTGRVVGGLFAPDGGDVAFISLEQVAEHEAVDGVRWVEGAPTVDGRYVVEIDGGVLTVGTMKGASLREERGSIPTDWVLRHLGPLPEPEGGR